MNRQNTPARRTDRISCKNKSLNHILIIGSTGHVSSVLMPLILGRGRKAATFDIMHCGDAFLLNDNPNPDVIVGAIRSCHGNSGKIMRLMDFTPKQNIRTSLGSMCRASCEGEQPEFRNGNRRYDTPRLKALDAA